MSCKGVCVRYKAQKPTGTGRYSSGQKRCQICEIFLDVGDKLWCPCCKYRIRAKPRNIKYKGILQDTKIKAGVMYKVYRKFDGTPISSGEGKLVKLLSDPKSVEQMWKVKMPKTRETSKNAPEFVVRFISAQTD